MFVRREMFLGWRLKRVRRWNMATEKLFYTLEYTFYDTIIIVFFRKVVTMNHIFIRFVCFCFCSSRQNLITERYFCIISLHCNCSVGKKSFKIPDKSNYKLNEKHNPRIFFLLSPDGKKSIKNLIFLLLSDLKRNGKVIEFSCADKTGK